MSFSSIERILAKIEQQPGWEEFRQYRQLLESWVEIVGTNTAKHTRPLYIQRQILWVATSSSARAQELTFQRYSLLKKINSHPVLALKDLKFSTMQWADRVTIQPNILASLAIKTNDRKADPPPVLSSSSLIDDRELVPITPDNLTLESEKPTPQTVVRDWIKSLEKKRQNLPNCPQCQVPTPKEELQRWYCCRYCIAKQWSIESPNFNFSNTSKNK
jgi:predicted nucleic acid-binding Zn ribbon protein